MARDKRKVQPDEMEGWFEASELRIPAQTRDSIIARIKEQNSYRWWRLNHDYKWLKRQMKKMGLNPDEARELLP